MTEQIKQEILEVLGFYADKENYIYGEYGYQLVAPIEFDRGNLARMVLKKLIEDTTQISYNKI
jgi:hypothetical protein